MKRSALRKARSVALFDARRNSRRAGSQTKADRRGRVGIAHVWSIYESRHNEDDPEPFMRGINSIQLFNDGKRWWIVNIYWQQAFGSLIKELASTAEIISRSANRN